MNSPFRKYIRYACGLPIIYLLGWTVYLSVATLTAQEVDIVVHGFDPRSLFSGHYIEYEFDWNKTDCDQFAQGRCPIKEFKTVTKRYYVPEHSARLLDSTLQSAGWNGVSDHSFAVRYSYMPGRRPIAKMFLIDGQEWFNYIKRKEK